MARWKYTDKSRNVVISEDGRTSILADALPPGTVVADPDPEPVEVRKSKLESALTDYIDSVAHSDGWDNIGTARDRAGYPGPFHDNALALAQWSDQCWVVALGFYNRFVAGEISEPSLEEIMAALPMPPTLSIVG